MILGLAVLTSVPSRYPYPTRPGRLNRLTLLLGVPWVLVLSGALGFDWDEAVWRTRVWASVLYPALYLGSAWALSLRGLVSGDARRGAAGG